MGHQPCTVFMPNKCVPCIQSSEHPILPCADTGLLRHETFSYCHNHSGCRHSVSIVNSNICSKYYPYHKTLASHLCSRPPALGWSVRLPHMWSGAHPGGAGGALHSGDIITIIIISIIISLFPGAGLPDQGVTLRAEEPRPQAAGQDRRGAGPGAQEQMGGQCQHYHHMSHRQAVMSR